MKKNIFKYCFLSTLSLGFFACSDDDEGSNDTSDLVSEAAVIENYADIVFQNYQDAYDAAEDMKGAIDAFVADPTEANFAVAKDAWLTAREPYGQTEAFRFANGPIDDADGPEGLLNAWPLDEAYVDYVDGDDTSGIINDVDEYPNITKEVLEGLNEVGGETNISVGYHAIEFLLWGQDLTDPSAQMPGQRAYTDFVDEEDGGTASNQDRRRDYLAACADLLLDHLQLMLDEWTTDGPYRQEFLTLDADEALGNMLTAIATLSKSELAAERMFVAYINQDQEDEHSCFSDNTHRDIRLNLDGIANVYRGSYGTISGSSLEDLILASDPEVGAEITALLAEAEEAVEATAEPFDFAISDATEGQVVVLAVEALQDLGDAFVEGAEALGLEVSSELPE